MIDNHLNQFRTELMDILHKEISCAKALFESLKTESLALSSLDEKLIALNSANKQKLIDSLQFASRTRIKHLAKQGYSTGSDNIKSFLASDISNSDIEMLFKQLKELSHQCYNENRLVGQLIYRRTQFIANALHCLSPSSNFKELTYGPKGSTSGIHKLRDIGTI